MRGSALNLSPLAPLLPTDLPLCDPCLTDPGSGIQMAVLQLAGARGARADAPRSGEHLQLTLLGREVSAVAHCTPATAGWGYRIDRGSAKF